MKVAIIGSRTFSDYNKLCEVIFQFENENQKITTIISGGAKGADSLGEKYADEHNISKQIFPAEWDKYGKTAGYIRNEDIIKNSDFVLAFWDGKSKGTKHSLHLAENNDINYWCYRFDKDKIFKFIQLELNLF